ncbi:MAG: hypothetical protein QXR97_02730 [Thermoproteota archaeon]
MSKRQEGESGKEAELLPPPPSKIPLKAIIIVAFVTILLGIIVTVISNY